jgi:hypothetical protein
MSQPARLELYAKKRFGVNCFLEKRVQGHMVEGSGGGESVVKCAGIMIEIPALSRRDKRKTRRGAGFSIYSMPSCGWDTEVFWAQEVTWYVAKKGE